MRRLRPALVLALVGLVAGIVGAVGPAKEIATTYSWPPVSTSGSAPSRAWYTPLLLIRQRPETISATLPCEPARSLVDAASPVTVLATARFPRRASGLSITREGKELVIAVGDGVLARVPGSGCPHRLRIDADGWSLEGASQALSGTRHLEAMPIVTGFFSALDLRADGSPSIAVTTAVHAVEPSALQKVAWAIAALALAGALLVVALPVLPRRPPRPSGASLKSIGSRAHPADAVVGSVLLAWWVLSPSFYDDGWVLTRQRMFSASGGFSNYYDTFGANSPLGYWLEWVQHWLAQSTSHLLVLRIPALLSLVGIWLLCRWILARVAHDSSSSRSAGIWVLAAAFLVGALAWGMTLRPEPVTALLTVGVLACCVRFLERGTGAPLAGAALLAPLAITGHHAGVVAFAPLLVISPSVLRWARGHFADALALLVATLALVVVLAFVGADLQQRRADAETYRAFTSTATTWRDEVLRYARLSEFPNATPLRRGSVVLIALAVLAFLLRPRSSPRMLLDLPAAALGLSLVLLIATPSKWAWHFGALIGVMAVAVAAETIRLREEAARSSGWRLRPFLVLGAVALAGAWLWSPRSPWSRLDLRTLDWTLGVESSLPFHGLALVLPFVALAVVGLAGLALHGRLGLRAAPWRAAVWSAPLIAVPAIAFTVGVLVADSARTGSWTLTRQNIAALRGEPDCGLADDVLVGRRLGATGITTLVVPELASYFPCARQPRLDDGIVEAPHIVVSPFAGTSWLSSWETSPFEGLLDLYPLEPLPVADPGDRPQELAVLEVDQRIPGFRLLPPVETEGDG